MTNSKTAYQELRSGKGWAGRMAIAALVNLVPILSFNNYGFFLGWARGAAAGEDSADLPKYQLNAATFIPGLLVAVIGIITGAAVGIVSGILQFIPIIGVIVSVAAFIIAGVLSNVMTIRYGVSGEFASAFRLKEVWADFKKNGKGAFEGTYLSLITILVAGIVFSLVVFGLLALVGDPAIATQSGPLAFFDTLGLGGLLISLIYAYGMSFLMVMIMGITFRAMGHWLARLP